jgi:prepilin-type processing-associated H-X9-DG protein
LVNRAFYENEKGGCPPAERNDDAFREEDGNDPRQGDSDIWLGNEIIGPWIASNGHSGVANYLYPDGHVESLIGKWRS